MRSLWCAALLAACSSAPRPVAAPAAPPPLAAEPPAPARAPARAPTVQVMTADTPWADTDGNSFIVPDGWKVSVQGAMTVVTAPEDDSRIAFVDASASTSEEALAIAWKT